jgi:hypothetical protein
MEFSVSDSEWIIIEAVKGCQEKIAVCDKVKRKIKVEKKREPNGTTLREMTHKNSILSMSRSRCNGWCWQHI